MFGFATLALLLVVFGHCHCAKLSPILYGKEASADKYPWNALIFRAGGGYDCGGVLIKRNVVLTTGFCVQRDASFYKVVLGLSDFKDSENAQAIAVSSIERNKGMALLYLKEVVRVNDVVEPVERLSTEELDELVLRREAPNCVLTGFGLKNRIDGTFHYPNKLQVLGTQIISEEECEERSAGNKNLINDDILCSYNEKGGFGFGDAGTGLVCRLQGEWTLMGVAYQFYDLDGLAAGTKYYHRISSFLDWINSRV